MSDEELIELLLAAAEGDVDLDGDVFALAARRIAELTGRI